MELQACILSRTSSRIFNSDKIPDKVLTEILDAARYAPSPKNRQPWRFKVLNDEEKMKLVKHYHETVSAQSCSSYHLMSNENDSVYASFHIIQQAPILILVFNKYPSEYTLSGHNSYFDLMNIQSIGAAIQNILLKATDLGIGSLWIGDIFAEESFILEQYPNNGKLIAGIVLGYSYSNIKQTNRLSLSKLIINTEGEDTI